MSTTESWFAIYLGRGEHTSHSGILRLRRARDTNNRRVIDQQVHIHGRLDGRTIKTDAKCRIALTRKQGRLVPQELVFSDGPRTTQIRFAGGRIETQGQAADQNGEVVPDDAMPTYAIFALAAAIYNQPEASIIFTPMSELTGQLGTSGNKLVCTGQTTETPFETPVPLWEVVWFSAEGTRMQAFYFDAKGELEQADWGGSRACAVASQAEATPPPKPARSGRTRKVSR